MSQFVKNSSARYQEALAVLEKLMAEEGFDHMHRAYAEAAQLPLEDLFARRVKGTRSKVSHVCLHRLWGKRCPERWNSEKRCLTGSMPAQYHLSQWNAEGKAVAVVSQPYGLGYEAMKETVEFCERHGLEADVSAESWHFSGATVLVRYRLPRKSDDE